MKDDGILTIIGLIGLVIAVELGVVIYLLWQLLLYFGAL